MRHATAILTSCAGGWLVALAVATSGAAAPCRTPQALGTSRILVVDPTDYPRIGGIQYATTLPLRDREVVLTFDDGPLPPYTKRVLDVLAAHCVKATFFLVGRQARTFPRLVARIHADGHTVATHSENHPLRFHRMALPALRREIEAGIESVQEALGPGRTVAPFFRIPGLLRSPAVEAYLRTRGLMTWSADITGDDWRRISDKDVTRRALRRLEAEGRGMLLLHDIQPATALALPVLLRELKARGFRIVHVVPATRERPKTPTRPEQWAARSRRATTVADGAAPPRATAAARSEMRRSQPQSWAGVRPARGTAARFAWIDDSAAPEEPDPAAPAPQGLLPRLFEHLHRSWESADRLE